MSEQSSGAKPGNRVQAILARRSVRWILALAVVVIALRVALPYAARSLAVSRADKALIGRVEIADLDFELLAGGLTVHGLQVHSGEAPAPLEASKGAAPPVTPPPAEPARPADPSPPAGAPIFAADRVYVNLGWLALLRKVVQVQTFEIDRFAIDVERTREGELVHPKPVPSGEPEPPEPQEETEPWGVVIDRIALRGGRLHFLDRAVSDPPQEFEGALPNLDAKDLALVVTEATSRAGTMVLDAAIRDGTLHFESTIKHYDTGQGFESHVVLSDLPIDNARAYVPNVGWTALQGRLDLDLTHSLVPASANSTGGKVTLRDLAIHVDGLDDAALAWGNLGVDIERFSLFERHASIGAVTLDGAKVVVNANGDEPLPVLRGLITAAEPKGDGKKAEQTQGASGTADADVARPGDAPSEAAAPDADAPAPAQHAEGAKSTDADVAEREGEGEGEQGDIAMGDGVDVVASPASGTGEDKSEGTTGDAPAAAPWTWDVARVTLRNSRVTVVGGDAPLSLDVFAEVSGLASKPGTRSTVKLGITPPQGSLAADGTFAIDPLTFDGKVHLDALSLPQLSTPVATPVTRLLARGVADGELTITAGDAPKAPRDGARVSGRVRLRDLEVVGDDPKTFALRWQSLVVEIADITAPGVLAPKPGAPPPPIDVKLASVTLDHPEIVATRTADGIALPAALGGAPADGDTAAPDEKAGAPAKLEPADAAPAAAGEADEKKGDAAQPVQADEGASSSAAAAAPVAVHVAKLAVDKMRVSVTDTAVKPAYRGLLDPIDVAATDVAWPGPRAGDVKVTAKGLDGATFKLTGKVSPEGSQLIADLAGLPLASFNPYATPTGYGVGGGVAAVRSNIKLGPGSYKTSNEIVLNSLQVTGSEGDSLFAQQFGMPLSMALALMTDLQGNIKLTLPVAGDRTGTRIGIAKVIRDALARAILNAATSPLKLIGAVANIGDKPASLAPQPVVFLDGRAELAKDEAKKLEQLGKLLASTPSVTLHLRAEASETDRRWLAEQKLRAQIDEESGLLGSVRHLGERGERKAALEVLEKRAKDEKSEMPEEHRAWFEENVARQKVSDEEMAQLARERATDVRSRLIEATKDVAPERIVVDEPKPEDLKARSVVAIGLGTAAVTPVASASTDAR